jgi:hypothetical protein
MGSSATPGKTHLSHGSNATQRVGIRQQEIARQPLEAKPNRESTQGKISSSESKSRTKKFNDFYRDERTDALTQKAI